jgi:hypothetical protein
VSFGGRFAPEELGGQDLGPFASLMVRIVLTSLATAFVVFVASAAMLFVTAPEWLSLIFEPLSLLMAPGLIAGLFASGPHDLNPVLVVKGSIVFYFLSFFCLLEWRAWRKRRARRRSRG